jgi:FAD/FMN-containing dehydrogenase
MNRVRAVDADNATITVEAGVTLAGVQAGARRAGLAFPLSLASEGSCTIGGNLATNAGGTAVLRYGNARDLVLGVEVVLADGSVLDLARGLRKDNTGYDLEAALHRRRRHARHRHLGGAQALRGAAHAGDRARRARERRRRRRVAAPREAVARRPPRRLRAHERRRARLSRKHHPGTPDALPGHAWYALVQADDSADDATLATASRRCSPPASSRGSSPTRRSRARSRRPTRCGPRARTSPRRSGARAQPQARHLAAGVVDPRRSSTRPSARFRGDPGRALRRVRHLGDGNLHYNLSAPEGTSPESFVAPAMLERAQRIVHDLVAARGGSISAEHGIGQLKRAELKRTKAPLELAVMRRIKAALDPPASSTRERCCRWARSSSGSSSCSSCCSRSGCRRGAGEEAARARGAARRGRPDGPLRDLRRVPAAHRRGPHRRDLPLQRPGMPAP